MAQSHQEALKANCRTDQEINARNANAVGTTVFNGGFFLVFRPLDKITNCKLPRKLMFEKNKFQDKRFNFKYLPIYFE